jgi:hypothetical protein
MSDPTVVTPTDPATPGWSAKLITFAIFILAGLPMSGLLDSHPALLKVLVLMIGGLGAIGYGGHAVALKRAHASGARSAAPPTVSL